MRRSLFIIVFLFHIIPILPQSFELINTKFETSGFECMAITPDGKNLISGHLDGTMVLWNLEKMQAIKRVEVSKEMIISISINANGDKLVVCGKSNSIKVYDLPHLNLVHSITTIEPSLNFATFSSDDKWIYYGGQNSTKKDIFGTVIANKPFGALYRAPSYEGLTRGVENLVDDENGAKILYSITDGIIDSKNNRILFSRGYEIFCFDQELLKITRKIKLAGLINSVAILDNIIYAWCNKDLLRIELRDSMHEITHKIKAVKLAEGECYSRIAISSNKLFVVTGDDGNNVNVWNSTNLKLTQSLVAHDSKVRSFAFSNGDSLLFTGDYGGALNVWRLNLN